MIKAKARNSKGKQVSRWLSG